MQPGSSLGVGRQQEAAWLLNFGSFFGNRPLAGKSSAGFCAASTCNWQFYVSGYAAPNERTR
jgi:hypothetical protein